MKRLSVNVTDLGTIATACITNHPQCMQVIALLRNGHPKAASYSASTDITPTIPTNGAAGDPEALTPPPAYSDRTGEIAYTTDQGARAGRDYVRARNDALRSLIKFEKLQTDLLARAPAESAPPRSDETWCTNHLAYGHFEPRAEGRDGLCRWCWNIRQDPDYGQLPTREAIDLKETTYPSRLPKDRLDQAMKPKPNTTTRTKKRRRRRN